MSESSTLFKLLDLDPHYEIERPKLDADAIIREAQRDPRDVELLYTFSHEYIQSYHHETEPMYIPRRRFPLHQAILLRAPIRVVEVLSCPTALKDARAALHLALLFNPHPSWDVVMLLLKRHPEAVKEYDFDGEVTLDLFFRRRAPLEVVSLLLKSWPDATKQKNFEGKTTLHLACECGSPLE
eukprot:5963677-Ditylum_brightwellii.AAC.1